MTLIDDRGIDPAECESCGARRGEFCDSECPADQPAQADDGAEDEGFGR